mgnify:CR=1 FL=1
MLQRKGAAAFGAEGAIVILVDRDPDAPAVARQLEEAGAAAVQVSNHGGRALDGTPAARPVISTAPPAVSYGQTFAVGTDVAIETAPVALMKLLAGVSALRAPQMLAGALVALVMVVWRRTASIRAFSI